MRGFWVTAVILLLWNLMGDAAYLAQVTADLDELAKTDPVTADAFRSMPQWAWSAYATAVWIGTAGAAALLMRRKIAWMLFSVSLIAVIAQFGWTFLSYDLIARKDATTAIFPLIIIAIDVFSVLYARRKTADGTLR